MRKIKQLLPLVSFSILSLGAQGLVFIFNIIVANKLSVSEYGTYSLILSVVNLILLLSCQWHTSMVQYCGSAEFAQKGCIKETNQVRNQLYVICYFVIFVICILFRNQINGYVGGKYVGVILVLVLAKGLQELFSSYLIAIGKRQLSAINMFLVQTVSIILLLIFNTGIVIVLLTQIIANILIVQMLLYVNLDDYKPYRVNSKVYKTCMKFAMWQLMGSVAIYIISYGDNYIIKHFLAYDDLAIYNAAYRIFSAVFMSSNTIATYYISPLAKALTSKNSKSIKTIFWNERIIIFILCAILHIGLIYFAPQLFGVLYQGKYNSSVLIFKILMFASIIRFWTVFEMVYFNSVGKIEVQQIMNVISAVLKVVLSIVFIMMFGLIGVAYSTLVSTFMVGCASFILSEKQIYKLSKSMDNVL